MQVWRPASLHHGEVSYGNIGATDRLDFTVVRRGVSLLGLIQGMCAIVDRPILPSEAFAALLGEGRTNSIGSFDLKGFANRAELYELRHHGLVGSGRP